MLKPMTKPPKAPPTPLHETSNNTSWVDELYAKRLARQDLNYIKPLADESNPLYRLGTVRRSRLYLRESLIPGPTYKQAIRVWFLDRAPPDPDGSPQPLTIMHCDYYPKTGEVRPDTAAAATHVAVTPHALERLHQRLRTNALGDVIRLALRPLSRLPVPDRNEWEREGMVVHLAGFGVFPVRVIGAIVRPGLGVPCWGVVTYIDREPKADEFVVHTIGPEQ